MNDVNHLESFLIVLVWFDNLEWQSDGFGRFHGFAALGIHKFHTLFWTHTTGFCEQEQTTHTRSYDVVSEAVSARLNATFFCRSIPCAFHFILNYGPSLSAFPNPFLFPPDDELGLNLSACGSLAEDYPSTQVIGLIITIRLDGLH